jgi:hypothetical protein
MSGLGEESDAILPSGVGVAGSIAEELWRSTISGRDAHPEKTMAQRANRTNLTGLDIAIALPRLLRTSSRKRTCTLRFLLAGKVWMRCDAGATHTYFCHQSVGPVEVIQAPKSITYRSALLFLLSCNSDESSDFELRCCKRNRIFFLRAFDGTRHSNSVGVDQEWAPKTLASSHGSQFL